MNKTQVRQYKGREAIYKGQPVTILRSRTVEQSGATNLTMVLVNDGYGNTFEVFGRTLAVPS